MTIKDLLIKFQEWQLENNVLNANFAHNTAAQKFIDKHPEVLDIFEPDEGHNFARADFESAGERFKDLGLIEKPTLPTAEQMKLVAKGWWRELGPVSFLAYNTELLDHAIPLELIKLPVNVIESILSDNAVSTESIFNEFLQPSMFDIHQKFGDELFVKLITRSPKDYLADINNYDRPKPVNGTSGIFTALASSARTFDDLCLLMHTPDNAYLVIRPYIKFPPYHEWRAYVNFDEIVGISQYYDSFFPDLTEIKIKKIETMVRNFTNEIAVPNIQARSFVIDYVCDGESIKIIETNPYGSSDPCLFGEYDEMDGSFRYRKSSEEIVSYKSPGIQ